MAGHDRTDENIGLEVDRDAADQYPRRVARVVFGEFGCDRRAAPREPHPHGGAHRRAGDEGRLRSCRRTHHELDFTVRAHVENDVRRGWIGRFANHDARLREWIGTIEAEDRHLEYAVVQEPLVIEIERILRAPDVRAGAELLAELVLNNGAASALRADVADV